MEKHDGDEKLKALRKKLFILGAYLVIALALLVYVSYSSFRISMYGDVLLPQADGFQAGFELTENLTSGSAVVVGDFLEGLRPGDSASKKCADDESAYRIDVKVSNGAIIVREVESNDPNVDPEKIETLMYSTLDLKYTLRITTSANMPLDFVLKSDLGTTYPAIIIEDEDREKRVYAFVDKKAAKDKNLTEVGTGKKYKEAELSIEGASIIGSNPANIHTTTNKDKVYVGWLPGSKYEKTAYQREVDLIELKADIVASKSAAYIEVSTSAIKAPDENPVP